MATKTFKIGLSNTDKQNMAQDVYERVLALTFAEYDSAETYNKGDFVVYDDLLYKCLADNVTGTWDSTKWQAATLQDLLDDVEGAVASVNGKANTQDLLNGTLVVAKATSAKSIEPISTESGAVQETPFVYQGTGTANGSAAVDTSPVGKHLEKQGNTVVVNQKSRELSSTYWGATGSSASFSNGVCTFTTTAQYGRIYNSSAYRHILSNGHKYLVVAKIKLTTATGDVIVTYKKGTVSGQLNVASSTANQILFALFTADANEECTITVQDNRTSDWDAIEISGIYLIDLTQWFNGDIPQDLLDNPDNFFRYYNGSLAYNEGTLETSDGRYLVCGGRNVWDEEWEVGKISRTTGENEYDTSRIRSKNYISVIPGADYYLYVNGSDTMWWDLMLYDKDKNFIQTSYLKAGHTITIPSNACYLRFTESSISYGTTYNNDITISLYYETGDGYDQYYPYEDPKVYDTGTEILRKAGSVKDTKDPDGTIHRRIGVVDLGSLTWNYDTNHFHALFNLAKASGKSICGSPLFATTYENRSYSTNHLIWVHNTGEIFVTYQETTDPTTFKTAMSGVYLFYELEEPTTEQGTPFSENIEINDYGTMGWLDTNDAYVEVPQGCKIFYPADYSLFIDSLGQREDINWDPLAIVSQTELAAYLTTLTGYDATKTQTLKNVNGTFTWVDDE